MKWVITKSSDNTNVGVSNTGRLKLADIEAYKQDCYTRFRLLDDDGNVYYEGWCQDLKYQSSDTAFEPMDAFENEGVTEMQYVENGKWVTL